MPRPVRFTELKRYLEAHGWTLVRVNGSHHTFARPGEYRPMVVPVHRGKVDAIYEKQAHKRCE